MRASATDEATGATREWVTRYTGVIATKIDKSSASAEISDRVELHWKWLFAPIRPVVTRGDSFWGRVALKLVVTTLVCVKLLINLWRFVPPEKRYCKKRAVYAVGGYARSLKTSRRRTSTNDDISIDVTIVDRTLWSFQRHASEMLGASTFVAVWLLLLTVTSTTVPAATERAPARRRAAEGCVRPLRRVEMFDVDLGSTSYRLREIHIRHVVKVRTVHRLSEWPPKNMCNFIGLVNYFVCFAHCQCKAR